MILQSKIIVFVFICLIPDFVYGHIGMHISTPANKIDQFCELADTCVHDTIPVCGMMGEQKRTFLDICDMLEFSCDNNKFYTHVDDMEGCPMKMRKEH